MKTILLLLISILLSACGESPLLNHESEPKHGVKDSMPYRGEQYELPKSGLAFRIDWDAPPQMGENQFTLKLWKKDSGTFNGPYTDPVLSLHVFLWMPSMGHGSSPVKITRLAAGEYSVSDVYFIMGGKWEVKVQLLENGKAVDEAVLPFSI